MRYFYHYFGTNNHISDQNEMHVKCPFPHVDPDTKEEYLEEVPSAHINIDKDVFHCKVCGENYSEAGFFAKMNDVTYGRAVQFLEEMEEKENDDWTSSEELLEGSPKALQLVEDLGLESVRDELRIGYNGSGIVFPVFMNDVLLAHMTYNPNGKPKAILSKGAKNLIFPFDLWQDDEPTLLCAGFKDAAIARAYGFNSITFTHGENSFPKLFKHSFKDKKVYIAYDNDPAGKEGSHKAAMFIKEAGGFPYIIDLSPVCTEKGEDIHDFFMKYDHGPDELEILMEEALPFDEDAYEKERAVHYPLVSLEEATEGRYHNKEVSSRISIIADSDSIKVIPEAVEIVKVREISENCTMYEGEKRTWYLDDHNLKDMLYLVESNEDKQKEYMRKLCNVPKNEKAVSIRVRSYINVFKFSAIDDVVAQVEDLSAGASRQTEILFYMREHSVSSGEKARVFYRTVPHPLQEQMAVGMVTRIEESDTAIKNFKVTPEVLDSIKCFQPREDQSVKQKMDELAEQAKAIAGPETLKQLAWAVDLFYHTPLKFKWGERPERAYLDTMIVGESRTGKSQTAKKLMDMYQVGVFTSLKSATVAGLIGGSDQTKGGFMTKLGVIPRNHRGAVIMEEFSGASRDTISRLTDIRSSNIVRLERVNGTTTAPAMVRMLSLSNQRKNSNGESIPLRQQASGVDVLINLIGAAEDIGRYDFFLLVDKPEEYIDPNTTVEAEAESKESYLNRVRWVWSRNPDQIVLDEDVRALIGSLSNKLNQQFDSHINFFGPEAWKKLTRVAIAVAGLLASHDETGEKLVVKQDHVMWAKTFLQACYDNELFNLRSYVEDERKYSRCPDTSVQALQGIYNQHKTLVLQLSKGTEFSQFQLKALSGLDNKEFNQVFNSLAQAYFVRYTRNGDKIIPSERFRKALKKITKQEYMQKVGAEY